MSMDAISQFHKKLVSQLAKDAVYTAEHIVFDPQISPSPFRLPQLPMDVPFPGDEELKLRYAALEAYFEGLNGIPEPLKQCTLFQNTFGPSGGEPTTFGGTLKRSLSRLIRKGSRTIDDSSSLPRPPKSRSTDEISARNSSIIASAKRQELRAALQQESHSLPRSYKSRTSDAPEEPVIPPRNMDYKLAETATVDTTGFVADMTSLLDKNLPQTDTYRTSTNQTYEEFVADLAKSLGVKREERKKKQLSPVSPASDTTDPMVSPLANASFKEPVKPQKKEEPPRTPKIPTRNGSRNWSPNSANSAQSRMAALEYQPPPVEQTLRKQPSLGQSGIRVEIPDRSRESVDTVIVESSTAQYFNSLPRTMTSQDHMRANDAPKSAKSIDSTRSESKSLKSGRLESPVPKSARSIESPREDTLLRTRTVEPPSRKDSIRREQSPIPISPEPEKITPPSRSFSLSRTPSGKRKSTEGMPTAPWNQNVKEEEKTNFFTLIRKRSQKKSPPPIPVTAPDLDLNAVQLHRSKSLPRRASRMLPPEVDPEAPPTDEVRPTEARSRFMNMLKKGTRRRMETPEPEEEQRTSIVNSPRLFRSHTITASTKKEVNKHFLQIKAMAGADNIVKLKVSRTVDHQMLLEKVAVKMGKLARLNPKWETQMIDDDEAIIIEQLAYKDSDDHLISIIDEEDWMVCVDEAGGNTICLVVTAKLID
ncbi:hypothetical protein EDD86DRAFT_246013 [Gorgonomyces haynaldii]|nr:hypothetical protein EDD86DRAFT_246013 [Gorgonomyces haynaldii]